MLDARLGYSLWALRLACGVLPIVSGLLKFNSLTTPARFAGVLELLLGVLIFTPFTRLGARLLTGWFLLLALTASLAGGYDMAVRDVLLAVGAFVLSRLTVVNEAAAPQPDALVAAVVPASPAPSGHDALGAWTPEST